MKILIVFLFSGKVNIWRKFWEQNLLGQTDYLVLEHRMSPQWLDPLTSVLYGGLAPWLKPE